MIRYATIEDLDAITKVETVCFPAKEAASREVFQKRLSVFPNRFWLLIEDGKIVSIINGMVTDSPKLVDEMFADVSLHKEEGDWQMIFGVETLPEYQGRGCAKCLMEHVIEEVRAQGKKGLVLTCKERLISYYEQFGFVNEGRSDSEHGGAVWYDLRLTF